MNEAYRARVRCLLDTGGYQLVFEFTRPDPAREYVDATIELSFPAELGVASVRSVPTFITVRDLRRLGSYLEAHIAELQEDSRKEAEAFVPLELGFQAQALSGEVDPAGEGEFTLRFMVNVGDQSENGGRVYVGAEGIVEVTRVRDFIAALEAVLVAIIASP